jgi:hypothetical protein
VIARKLEAVNGFGRRPGRRHRLAGAAAHPHRPAGQLWL